MNSFEAVIELNQKQCNGIIKGWLHFLTSKSKRRLFVDNMVQIPTFFNNNNNSKMEIRLPEHLLTSNNISFLPYPNKVDVICVLPLKKPDTKR